jgi:plasmid maintenance system antidote protein VapI
MEYKPPTNELIRSIVLQGHNVTEAAKLLRIGRSALSNVLNGKADLSLPLATKIEDVFRYSGLALLKDQVEYKYQQFRKDVGSLICPVCPYPTTREDEDA